MRTCGPRLACPFGAADGRGDGIEVAAVGAGGVVDVTLFAGLGHGLYDCGGSEALLLLLIWWRVLLEILRGDIRSVVGNANFRCIGNAECPLVGEGDRGKVFEEVG